MTKGRVNKEIRKIQAPRGITPVVGTTTGSSRSPAERKNLHALNKFNQAFRAPAEQGRAFYAPSAATS